MTEAKIDLTRKCAQCQERFGSDVTVCPADGSILIPLPPPQAADPFVGTTLGQNYEILSIAGKGGMGVVYKARHRALDRTVAIKVLKAEFVSDENSYLRFQVEAVAASRLAHPNVVAVFDYGVAPTGQPFLIMEFVEGTSLSSLISEHGALTMHRALPIFMQACNALEHAHRHNVIHRDVKPSNTILIQAEGQPDLVKIVDFGIAQIGELQQDGLKITKTGEVFGSPVYMSPEQCTGEGVDQRTDIYSLGALMYETLTGVAPLVGPNSISTIQKKFSEEPKPFVLVHPNGNVPAAIEAVVMKTLQKEPNRRFQTMPELKNAIETAAHGYSMATRSMTGMPALAIPSEFAGMDMRKEIEMASLSAHKLKSRAKAARLLGGVEKDAAPVHIEKLRSSEPDKGPPPLPKMFILGAVAIVALGLAAWLYLPHSKSLSVTGKVSGFTADHKMKEHFAVATADGKTFIFDADSTTKLSGKLKKGLTARVVYSNQHGKLHADEVTIQH